MPAEGYAVPVEVLAPSELVARMALPSSVHAPLAGRKAGGSNGGKAVAAVGSSKRGDGSGSGSGADEWQHLSSWHTARGEAPSSQAEALAAAARCCPLGLTSVEQLERAVVPAGGGESVSTGVVAARRVNSVALVSSLPEDLFLATIAHEVGHVFLHLTGLHSDAMSDKTAEGLCELVSYLWEHRCHVVGEGDESERRRRMHAMETSKDEIYGEGFREALAAYKACGHSLPTLISRVRESGGQLPSASASSAREGDKRTGRAFGGRVPYRPLGEPMRADTRGRARAFDESRRRRSPEPRMQHAAAA